MHVVRERGKVWRRENFHMVIGDTDMATNLLQILLLLFPVLLLTRVDADGQVEINADENEETKQDISQAGLRWANLGVSFEACDGSSDFDCSDDSMWLLHPSSGFVENGSLCGILGPSG